MQAAAAYGNLSSLQRLTTLKAKATPAAMDAAASAGYLTIVQWLHDNRREGCTNIAMDEAAKANNMDLVKWLNANRYENCSTNAMDSAAEFGHLEMVKWLHANRWEGCTMNAMDKAAENGHLEVVKFLHLNTEEDCSESALDNAAKNGHLDMVKWLRESRPEGCPTKAMCKAATNGHVAVVVYLFENRASNCKLYDPDDDALEDYQGRVNCPSCVHGLSGKFGESEFFEAAREGHLAMVKWFWTHIRDICTLVKPHLFATDRCWPIVKYLVQNCNLPFNNSLLKAAAESKRFDVIEWLVEYAQTTGFTIEDLPSD